MTLPRSTEPVLAIRRQSPFRSPSFRLRETDDVPDRMSLTLGLREVVGSGFEIWLCAGRAASAGAPTSAPGVQGIAWSGLFLGEIR